MATEQELLQIEQDAQQLKDNLKQLHGLVGSYSEAKTSLEETNKKLSDFIEQTQQLAQETHQLIKVAREIGSAKILEKLINIEKKSNQQFVIIIGAVGLTFVVALIKLFIK